MPKGPAIKYSVLIENETQMADFLATLPADLPSKREPAPPNPDPLRKGHKIDFSKNVLAVVIHRDTISAYPTYQGLEATKGARVVKFDVPSPPPEARPYGWGVYSAVVLPKAGDPLTVEIKDVKGDW